MIYKDIKFTKKEFDDIISYFKERVYDMYFLEPLDEHGEYLMSFINHFEYKTFNYAEIMEWWFDDKIEILANIFILDPKSLYKWHDYNEKECLEFKKLIIKEYGFEEDDID